MKRFIVLIYLLFMFLSNQTVYAAHPLITDDTGTQGKGKFQLEINTEYGKEREYGFQTETSEISTILSYGVFDNVDIVLGLPYQFVDEKDLSTNEWSKVRGISDATIELKWWFYEKDGLSLALKPGISLPTGEYDKGLTSDKIGYGGVVIVTKEIESLTLHTNLGYFRNENKNQERKDIWHASLAGELAVINNLNLVGNVGIETNPDPNSNTHPAFALIGVIYSFSENLSIDFGYKYGLNKPETDNTFLAGLAIKF